MTGWDWNKKAKNYQKEVMKMYQSLYGPISDTQMPVFRGNLTPKFRVPIRIPAW